MKKLLSLLPLILFFACSPTESETTPDPEPEIVQKPLFIKEIILDGETFRTYEYDEEDRLSSNTYYTSGIADFVYGYEYQNDRTIETGRVEGEEYNRMEYYWQDENTIRKDITFGGILSRYVLYKFSEETCGHISEETFNASGDLETTLSIEYLDDLCSRNESSESARVDGTKNLDDKNHYEKNAMVLPLESSGGNIITSISRDGDGNTIDAWSYDSEFKYNENNYPVSETRTYRSGKVEEFQYIYY